MVYERNSKFGENKKKISEFAADIWFYLLSTSDTQNDKQ